MLSNKCMRLHERTCYPSHILMKVSFSRHIFEKYSNIKFHKNPSSGSRVVQYGRTDEHTDRQDALLRYSYHAYSYN